MSWYEKKWFVWLMIIICFPIGLALMWKSPAFGTKTRVIVTGFFALLVIGGMNRDPNATTTQPVASKTSTPAPAPAPKQYAAVDVNTMMNDLERNAAAAQRKYKGQSVCVTGRIGVIDSNGDYIVLLPDNEFAITGVICNLNGRDKSQSDFLMSVQMGQYVRAYGEINDVGEVAGYMLKVEKFSLAN
ncbi:MAG: hypothetical protein J5497_02110 [Selenomonadaceae bacterium]|nr:hypothetical protein [Selenomonadaceae bacterium]